MNPHASKLGKLAKGVPKQYTAAEITLRSERLRKARALRWPKKPAKARAARLTKSDKSAPRNPSQSARQHPANPKP